MVKEYVTRAELIEFGSKRPINERIEVRDRAKNRSAEGSTFLSHSTKDDELVDGAIIILEQNGASVYTDKIDSDLPPYTSDETAAKLKKRVRQCNKFVLLASENSKKSNWVPWELGIADGVKDLTKIAVFPAIGSETDDQWTSWEYIGLYRKIIWADFVNYKKPIWVVWDKKSNTGTPLKKWLNG